MAISPDARYVTATSLDMVLEVIGQSPFGATIRAHLRERARADALALLSACESTAAGLSIVTVGYAAELLESIVVDLAADPRRTRHLADELQARAAVPRLALGRHMLRAGRLLELGVDVAIEVQLSLLLAFTGAGAVSLWRLSADAQAACVAAVGESDDVRARVAALTVLTRDSGELMVEEHTLALRVDAQRPSPAALIATGIDPPGDGHGPLLTAAAPTLAAALDRQTLLGREQPHASVTGAIERRLARLRFDLHDGPQQDVHLLAQDLRLFRDQLRPLIAGHPDQARAMGRLDDLEARLIALDGDLRRLTTSVQSPFVDSGSLQLAVQRLTDVFAQRTGILPETDFSGDLTRLSDSGQIAVLSLIREALSNIRKHSDAESVRVVIASDEGGVTVEVTDDGSGFDPDATAAQARRAGRLGLVGMHERVRMLGGQTQVQSQSGGPTVVSATLPPWPAARL